MGENFYHAYPLYDWTTKDVWVANGKFDFDYNHIYDLFYKAGLSINQMRVASPYHESAKDSLNLYRVLEPDTWIRVVGRVQGANFGAIYGSTKALGARKFTLPPGHTWRSYVKFCWQPCRRASARIISINLKHPFVFGGKRRRGQRRCAERAGRMQLSDSP